MDGVGPQSLELEKDGGGISSTALVETDDALNTKSVVLGIKVCDGVSHLFPNSVWKLQGIRDGHCVVKRVDPYGHKGRVPNVYG